MGLFEHTAVKFSAGNLNMSTLLAAKTARRRGGPARVAGGLPQRSPTIDCTLPPLFYLLRVVF